jgi:mannosyltransferase
MPQSIWRQRQPLRLLTITGTIPSEVERIPMALNIKDHTRSLILCILLIFGFAIRFYQLGAESIWLDEGHSILTSKLDLLSIILRKDDVPPLYFVLLHFWIKIFCDSEFCTRLPSLVFGVLSILWIFKIGKLIFDERKGFLAALLLTISRFCVDYSQEARMYSLAAFLTLLSMYYLIKLNKEKGGRTASIGYLLSSALLIYSHVFGLFIILAQNVYMMTLFAFSRSESDINLKHWALLQGALFVLFLPWIPTFMVRVLDETRGSYLNVPTKMMLVRTFMMYSAKYIFWLYLLLAFLSVATIRLVKGALNNGTFFSLIEKSKFEIKLLDPEKNFLLLLWLGMPIVLPFVLSKVVTPFYEFRYTIVAAPAFYLLVASGIGNIGRIPVRSSAIALIVFFNFMNLHDYYNDVTHEQWRDVAEYVDRHSRDDDLVIFNSRSCIKYGFDYYSQAKAIRKFLPKDWNHPDDEGLTRLGGLINNHARVWVVLSHPKEDKPVIEALNKQYRQLEFKIYHGIKLYLFAVK